MLTNALCAYYGEVVESLFHILYECQFALDTRNILKVETEVNTDLSTMAIWRMLKQNKGHVQLWTEILICWKIWNAMNKKFVTPN